MTTIRNPVTRVRSHRGTDLLLRVLTFLVLGLAAIAIVAPVLWIFRGAISPTDAELYRLPPTLPSAPAVGNFGKVFAQVPFAQFALNSIIVATSITLLQLITASTAGYAFARLNFRGKNVAFTIVIGGLMIPLQVTIVPLFLIMTNLGLTNTLWALILPPIFSAFGIFLMRQHFLSLPRELEEAARIDGAGHLRMFFQVMLPLSGPALATLAILTFTYWWNDLFVPLVMISSVNQETLPVGLVLLAGRYGTGSLGTIAAGITMAIIPVLIVFILAQRWIVQSIASSGLKI
jgi:ABC-type glycerol-3-phosphate transport system permease component